MVRRLGQAFPPPGLGAVSGRDAQGIESGMTSRGVKSESSELSRGDSAVPSISLALLATALGGGALLGAAVAAATANRSQPDDVISGEISIDLLKKVELLTIRLR